MANKPSIPSGTRDFGPEEVAKDNTSLIPSNGCITCTAISRWKHLVMENLSTLLASMVMKAINSFTAS